MTRQELNQIIQEAEKLVRSWPEWKRSVLANSSASTVPIPRKPVVNLRN